MGTGETVFDNDRLFKIVYTDCDLVTSRWILAVERTLSPTFSMVPSSAPTVEKLYLGEACFEDDEYESCIFDASVCKANNGDICIPDLDQCSKRRGLYQLTNFTNGAVAHG